MSEKELNTSVIDLGQTDPDSIEVAAGFQHENLEHWVPEMAAEAEIFDALEKAFDYRGDIKITRKDGVQIEGYIFDRRAGKSLEDSVVRLFPAGSNEKLSVRYAEVARLEFGKDRAAGKHWEDWVRKYNEKKAAGEKNIGLQPEALDEGA